MSAQLLLEYLEHSLRHRAGLRPGELLLVAFSGGPDSTALLWGLKRLAPSFGLRLHAAHLDHALDPDSRQRAQIAESLAARLSVPFSLRRLTRRPVAGESREAFARRMRYAWFESLAGALGARYVVTAHHADDQAETVLLRMRFGSGVSGLAGIRARHGLVLRPLLDLPSAALARALEAQADLEPTCDPTNLDITVPRNAIRHDLLPRLRVTEPRVDFQLCQLATAAERATTRLERRLTEELLIRPCRGGATAELPPLTTLPKPLLPIALATLHRAAGAPYPPSREARQELVHQLERGAGIGCDAGGGWRWEGSSNLLRATNEARREPPEFTYALKIPGAIDIEELGLRFRMSRRDLEPWMLRGRRERAALNGAIASGTRVLIRNRRPGDRIRPLRCPYTRRLKDLLIEHSIPRWQRSWRPLLWIDGALAWVPGVTIGDHFRLRDGDERAWVTEIAPMDRPKGNLFPADLV